MTGHIDLQFHTVLSNKISFTGFDHKICSFRICLIIHSLGRNRRIGHHSQHYRLFQQLISIQRLGFHQLVGSSFQAVNINLLIGINGDHCRVFCIFVHIIISHTGGAVIHSQSRQICFGIPAHRNDITSTIPQLKGNTFHIFSALTNFGYLGRISVDSGIDTLGIDHIQIQIFRIHKRLKYIPFRHMHFIGNIDLIIGNSMGQHQGYIIHVARITHQRLFIQRQIIRHIHFAVQWYSFGCTIVVFILGQCLRIKQYCKGILMGIGFRLICIAHSHTISVKIGKVAAIGHVFHLCSGYHTVIFHRCTVSRNIYHVTA